MTTQPVPMGRRWSSTIVAPMVRSRRGDDDRGMEVAAVVFLQDAED